MYCSLSVEATVEPALAAGGAGGAGGSVTLYMFV